MLVVRTQVKDILRELQLGVEQMSNDFMDVLDREVREVIETAARRAHANGRRTVMGRDV